MAAQVVFASRNARTRTSCWTGCDKRSDYNLLKVRGSFVIAKMGNCLFFFVT